MAYTNWKEIILHLLSDKSVLQIRKGNGLLNIFCDPSSEPSH